MKGSIHSSCNGGGNGGCDDVVVLDDGDDGGVSISKANIALFDKLLGDDASALGGGGVGGNTKNNQQQQHPNNNDETSTTMSSVLGPILRLNARNTNSGARDGEPPTKTMALHSSNKQFNQPPQQQQQQSEQNNIDDDFANDEDTYMTKPREISFDMHSDDVSALFGGNCGASTTGGMGSGGFAYESSNSGNKSSYGASFAAQRKNRQRGLLHWQQQQHQPPSGRHSSSRQRGGMVVGQQPTVHHGGVESILEEIGFRPSSSSSSKKSDGFDDEASGGKGKGRRNSSSRWSSSSRGGSNNRHSHPPTSSSLPDRIMEYKRIILERMRSTMRLKYWITLLIGIMYLSVQFRTVRNHERETLDHLNWRFQHNRRRPSVELSDVMRRIATGGGGEEGQRGIRNNDINEYNNHRFRSVVGGEDAGMMEEMEFLKENHQDGLFPGDVSRRNVPQISKHHALERNDNMLLDDDFGIANKNGNNLRGGGGGGGGGVVNQPLPGMQRQSLMQQLPPQEQLGNKMMMGDEMQSQQQLGAHIKSLQQKNEIFLLGGGGDTHPLLEPKPGLSMSDALDKLGTDKLSDIDPRPQQQLLSNDIIPPRFHAFADVKTPYVVGRDTPFFWHVPRSGGVVVKTMLSHCLNQTLAAEVGEMDGHQNDSVSATTYGEY